MKVLLTTSYCNPPLTTSYCNPPLTRIIECDNVHYNENRHTLGMYAKRKRGKTCKLIAYAITDDWASIVIIDNEGEKHIIK